MLPNKKCWCLSAELTGVALEKSETKTDSLNLMLCIEKCWCLLTGLAGTDQDATLEKAEAKTDLLLLFLTPWYNRQSWLKTQHWRNQKPKLIISFKKSSQLWRLYQGEQKSYLRVLTTSENKFIMIQPSWCTTESRTWKLYFTTQGL